MYVYLSTFYTCKSLENAWGQWSIVVQCGCVTSMLGSLPSARGLLIPDAEILWRIHFAWNSQSVHLSSAQAKNRLHKTIYIELCTQWSNCDFNAHEMLFSSPKPGLFRGPRELKWIRPWCTTKVICFCDTVEFTSSINHLEYFISPWLITSTSKNNCCNWIYFIWKLLILPIVINWKWLLETGNNPDISF